MKFLMEVLKPYLKTLGKNLPRETAHQLNLSNADSINWTLFASSSSDSASTQKKLMDSQMIAEKSMKKSTDHLKTVELK